MDPQESKMNDIVKTLSTIIGIIAITFSVFFFQENRYASQVSYAMLERKVEIREIKELLKDALESMYFYQKMLRQDPDNEELKKKLGIIEEEVADLKAQIKDLNKVD